MARPSKPAAVLKGEKKSHKTKAEIAHREKAEAALLSGQPLQERASVKADKIAHAEFLRVSKILRAIDKDDALYSAVVNRYCEIYSEIIQHQQDKAMLTKLKDKLEAKINEVSESENVDEKKLLDILKAYSNYLRQLNNIDLSIQTKRKMLSEIEKENCMTVAAALRAIPKQPESSAEDDMLRKILSGEEV